MAKVLVQGESFDIKQTNLWRQGNLLSTDDIKKEAEKIYKKKKKDLQEETNGSI